MKANKRLFWTATLLINLVLLEIGLRCVFFQRRSTVPFAIMAAFHEAKMTLSRTLDNQQKVGIWTRDNQYGYSHIANSRGTHETSDYSVTYAIGSEKERFIPKPQNSLGRILFLGGSFTFGQGVDNDDTFPHILSTHWKQRHILNKAVMGWGTSHAYMLLLQEMKSPNPPEVTIYVMIPHHITRNYIRRSWVQLLDSFDRAHPHFKLIDGELILKGVVDGSHNLPENPEVLEQEIALTQRFLIEMQDISSQNETEFVVILLGKHHYASIYNVMVENNINVLDLSNIEIEGFESGDRHPNPNDHRRISQEILSSFIPDLLDDKRLNN